MRTRSTVFAVAAVFLLCAKLSAQPKCKVQHLEGTWSLSFMGWAIPLPGGPLPPDQTLPVVGIGLLTVDHRGVWKGPATAVVGGMTFEFEMEGTMEVGPDCAGLVKYSAKFEGIPTPMPGYIERFVLDLARGEIVSASIASPISKPMWISTMKRISNSQTAIEWPEIPPAD
jgi:hypothetical protein